MGEGIGLAMRGLRPIAEIQYLDYLLYGLQPLSDDLACLSYRTKGGQKAPLIVRTRGHRPSLIDPGCVRRRSLGPPIVRTRRPLCPKIGEGGIRLGHD